MSTVNIRSHYAAVPRCTRAAMRAQVFVRTPALT